VSISLPNQHLYTVTALNLKHFELNEADRVYTLFSKEYGIIRAVANDVKKTTSKFGGRMEILRSNHLVIRKTKGLHKITQCDSDHYFPHLLKDYDRLMHALLISEMLSILCEEQDPHPHLFHLTIETLKHLESVKDPILLLLWFELKMLQEIGFEQTLSHCYSCSHDLEKQNYSFFDMANGGLLCKNCKTRDHCQFLNREQYKVLKLIQKHEEVLQMNLPRKILIQLQHILQTYIQHIAERKLKTLAFLEWGTLDEVKSI